MEFYSKEMGERIRKLRKEKHLTQENLSEKMGISAQYLSEIERGIKNIGVDKLTVLCQILEVTLDQIVFGDIKGHRNLGDFKVLLKDASEYEALIMFEVSASIKRVLRKNRDKMN